MVINTSLPSFKICARGEIKPSLLRWDFNMQKWDNGCLLIFPSPSHFPLTKGREDYQGIDQKGWKPITFFNNLYVCKMRCLTI